MDRVDIVNLIGEAMTAIEAGSVEADKLDAVESETYDLLVAAQNKLSGQKYRVTYVREPWSEHYETGDTPDDGVLGEFSWAEMQDNLTNGNHGSGWVPGRYRVEREWDGDREASFDIVIGDEREDTTIKRLKALPTDLLLEWLDGAFVGDTGKILADCLARGKDDPERLREAAASE